MSKWIEWKGGACPVAPGTMVEIETYDGRFDQLWADHVAWGTVRLGRDVIAPVKRYRVMAMSIERFEEATARIKRLGEALSSIDIYLSDTLSGRVNGTPGTYTDWLIDGIREARNRARAAYKGEPDENTGGE